MSGLFENVIDRLLEPTPGPGREGDRWEASRTADFSPAPPGIAALPPNPHAITAGLDAIRAHDPAFDQAQLLNHARQVFHDTTGSVTAPLAEMISAVDIGPVLDAVTVRFGTASGEEEWVFQRSASATTPSPGGPDGRCPNCGAPLQLDAAGACPYCHATVSAAPGWVLAARNRLRPMTPADAAALAAVVGSQRPAAAEAPPPPPAAAPSVDVSALATDAYSILATAREIGYLVAEARSQRRPDLVRDRVTGDLARQLDDEARTLGGEHRHHVICCLEIDGATIVGADHRSDGDTVTVRMAMTGEEYELADANLGSAAADQTLHSWTEEWVLTRTGTDGDWLASSSRRLNTTPRAA